MWAPGLAFAAVVVVLLLLLLLVPVLGCLMQWQIDRGIQYNTAVGLTRNV